MNSYLAFVSAAAVAASAANNWASYVPSPAAGAPKSAETAPSGDSQAGLLGQDRALDQKVSVSFDNASLADVLRWLSSTGVNFAAETSETGAAKITINVHEQPLREVMLAISEAFGGSWQKKGDIYVFKRLTIRAMDLDLPFMEPGGRLEGERAKELAERMRELAEEFRRKFEKGELPRTKGRVFIWPRPEGEEFLEKHPEIRLRIEKLLGEDWLEYIRELREQTDNSRVFKFEGRGINMGGNLSKLMDSLTQEQWAKHRDQGYLTPADLTEEQRKMLGDLPTTDTFTITVVINDRTLTIKNLP